ncbi:hydroxyethylthiazole kinase [Pectinatus brassicae]|uniref:Hydroxyethylthiazole kinase n=1 Tax=Pectinatus brassicae TaxID=862415 RepID=A0A840UJP7_9FIRM|nr:hydroxyethylthiazole kinase [Pectinatus brassicae]MBB5337219.1 hydroxyethylthiazole kinase [Pectinatus brassicae]
MLGQYLQEVRKKAPLIHNITNYVTVNDCANILLACGASPIMADDKNEAAEITAICNGLNINIGTLNERTIDSMLSAGEKAAQLQHPILLDPVGAGASAMRTATAKKILDKLPITVLRGNISEIKILSTGQGIIHGVDANAADRVTEDNLFEYMKIASQLAGKLQTIVAISGEIDIIADKDQAAAVSNGHSLMSKITGSGCMLSALTTAYAAANQQDIFTAVLAAFCSMGIAGEIAANRMTDLDGNASFRNYLIDAVYNMTAEQLDTGAKYQLMVYND